MKKYIVYFLILGWLCQGYGCETGEQGEEKPSQLMEDIYRPKHPELTRYLHFTEYQIFYDLDSARYIFLEENQWKTESDLPTQYNRKDIWRSPIRELKYRGSEPQRQVPDYHPAEPGDSIPAPARSDSLAL